MSLFWELHQTKRIGEAESRAAQAKRTATSARQDMAEMQERCDKALMVCEALWTILRDKFKLTDEHLVARINELDLSDGRLDGRVKKEKAVRCPECDRTISRRFPRCMYCGTVIVHDPFS